MAVPQATVYNPEGFLAFVAESPSTVGQRGPWGIVWRDN